MPPKGKRKNKTNIINTKKRYRNADTDESESEEKERTQETQRSTKNAHPPGSFQVAARDHCLEETDVSSIQYGESVTNTIDQDKWRMMEERLKSMEDRVKGGGGVSVVSGSTITPPVNDRILKENLRKFVAAKVFPNWKFIFKKEKLELCVMSAITKGFITVPPGFEESKLAYLYSATVRACLDGCRANAQTAARKRYLSK